jgi:hypothetical protein
MAGSLVNTAAAVSSQELSRARKYVVTAAPTEIKADWPYFLRKDFSDVG